MCIAVDRYSKFLFRPGAAAIVASKACLDVGKRNSGHSSGKRSPKSARCVTLNDDEIGSRSGKCREQEFRDVLDMRMGVVAPDAVEHDRTAGIEPLVRRAELRMLAGEDQKRFEAPLSQSMSDRGELDGFGTSAEYKNDGIWQPSP